MMHLDDSHLAEGGVFYANPVLWPWDPRVRRQHDNSCPNRKGPFLCLFLTADKITIASVTSRDNPQRNIEIPKVARVGGSPTGSWRNKDSFLSFQNVLIMPREVFCECSDSAYPHAVDRPSITSEALEGFRRRLAEATNSFAFPVAGDPSWVPSERWIETAAWTEPPPQVKALLEKRNRLSQPRPAPAPTGPAVRPVLPPPPEVVPPAVHTQAKPAPTCAACGSQDLAVSDVRSLFKEANSYRMAVGHIQDYACCACGHVGRSVDLDPRFRDKPVAKEVVGG